MRSASNNKEKHHQLKEEGFKYTVSRFFCLTCIATITIFSLHLIFNNKTINFNPTNSYIQPNKEIEACDLFRGRWIQDSTAPLYDHHSCKTIPPMRNCLSHKKSRDFLNWKWKPDQCELPRFSPLSFLITLRGKKMAFIGDSLARNQVDSLLCLLSTVETPKSKEKDKDDRNRTWEFRKHNFTLSVLWSQYFVAKSMFERKPAAFDGFNLHLDRIDSQWTEKLPSIDYAVFSDGHWFLRENYLYEGDRVIGCINCNESNIIDVGPGPPIRAAFRAALRAVNGCEKCEKRIVSFVRTYSPAHFENGWYNTGGTCNRTRIMEREEANFRAGPELEYRKIQVEEVEMARKEGEGRGNEFEILDITEMMATRVEGHPGRHWRGRGKKGSSSDCVHWCLPGPIDTWNALLLEKIKRLEIKLSHN